MIRKIVITGGHLTPAIAVIQELQLEKDDPWQIYYFGRKVSLEGTRIASVESKIIPGLGAVFVPINPGRWQRRFSFYTLLSLLRVPFGFVQAIKNLLKIKPDLILSFGSYVSTPVVVAGWILGIPIISHEQTMTAGLANIINSYFSTKIAVSFKESLNHFPGPKTVFTGNPIRKDIFTIKENAFIKEIRRIKEQKNLPLIYVTGGNQGSATINKFILDNLTILLKNYLILHQTGSLEYQNLLLAKSRLKGGLRENYFVKDFISSEEIGWVFKNSDLVISRSGANICYELGCLAKPAILVPLPFSYRNEQLKNALKLKEFGLAEILPEDGLKINDFNLFFSRLRKKGLSEDTDRLSDYFPKNGAARLVKIMETVYEQKNQQKKFQSSEKT